MVIKKQKGGKMMGRKKMRGSSPNKKWDVMFVFMCVWEKCVI